MSTAQTEATGGQPAIEDVEQAARESGMLPAWKVTTRKPQPTAAEKTARLRCPGDIDILLQEGEHSILLLLVAPSAYRLIPNARTLEQAQKDVLPALLPVFEQAANHLRNLLGLSSEAEAARLPYCDADEHPDGYDGPCGCRSCQSYGEPVAETA